MYLLNSLSSVVFKINPCNILTSSATKLAIGVHTREFSREATYTENSFGVDENSSKFASSIFKIK